MQAYLYNCTETFIYGSGDKVAHNHQLTHHLSTSPASESCVLHHPSSTNISLFVWVRTRLMLKKIRTHQRSAPLLMMNSRTEDLLIKEFWLFSAFYCIIIFIQIKSRQLQSKELFSFLRFQSRQIGWLAGCPAFSIFNYDVWQECQNGEAVAASMPVSLLHPSRPLLHPWSREEHSLRWDQKGLLQTGQRVSPR